MTAKKLATAAILNNDLAATAIFTFNWMAYFAPHADYLAPLNNTRKTVLLRQQN